MLYFNKKMKNYLVPSRLDSDVFEYGFRAVGKGYFFESFLSGNVLQVVSALHEGQEFDWGGYEYTTNKIHLEDYFEGSIPDVAKVGVSLLQKMQRGFSEQFPDVSVVFVLSCDADGEFPSVPLTFYVIRDGELPIMPFSNDELDSFNSAVLVSTFIRAH